MSAQEGRTISVSAERPLKVRPRRKEIKEEQQSKMKDRVEIVAEKRTGLGDTNQGQTKAEAVRQKDDHQNQEKQMEKVSEEIEQRKG